MSRIQLMATAGSWPCSICQNARFGRIGLLGNGTKVMPCPAGRSPIDIDPPRAHHPPLMVMGGRPIPLKYLSFLTYTREEHLPCDILS